MKVALFGFGKMGKAIEQLAIAQGHEVLQKISKKLRPNESILSTCDVFIDFSSPDAVLSHIELACRYKKPIVVGTTGWEHDLPKAKKRIEESKNSALYAPNFSLGMHAFFLLLQYAQKLLTDYDCAGVETHHHEKKDAPSGTAKAMKEVLKLKNEFASIRCGTLCGKHEILFDSPFDTIQLIHTAKNREAFAQGAIQAANWIKHKNGWFTIDDLTRSLYGFDHSV